MKLHHSATSPYVRKVMACAIACGLHDRITRVETNPHASPPALVADNPLSKVPCLVTDDGVSLFDSPVICEYLDSRGDELPMFPPAGAARWRALKLQAVGDGIMDAAVMRRMEAARPREDAREASMERARLAVERSLALLEAEPPANHLDVGAIAVACALGYLDFRFASEPWRDEHPRLAAWCAAFAENPGIARTVPAD